MPEQRKHQPFPQKIALWFEPKNYFTIEFGKLSYGEFLKQRLSINFRVKRAIVDTLPQNEPINGKENTSVRKLLEIETLNLLQSRNTEDTFATDDLKCLTNHQLLQLQHNLIADVISQSETPENEMLGYDLQTVQQIGVLIKYMDYFGVERPNRLNTALGNGKHHNPQKTYTDKISLWFIKDALKRLNIEKLPKSLRPLLTSILDQSYVNERSFSDIPTELRQVNINGRQNSSMEADLRHQVINIVDRIDRTSKTAKDIVRLPSAYEIESLPYGSLVSLYENLTVYFVRLFEDREVKESKIDWYGKKYSPKEFLTISLEHVMLHQGHLQFFYENIIQ